MEQAQKQAQVEANKQAVRIVFKIGDKPIENVLSFKYLGMILAANDDDLPAMVANVRWACQHWDRFPIYLCVMVHPLRLWGTSTRLYSRLSFYIDRRLGSLPIAC